MREKNRSVVLFSKHVLHISVRALDYIPPVDITFGEYLRGIVTADFDVVPDDTFGYRVAFVEAFRRRGIYPDDLDTLSVDTLRWQGVDISAAPQRFGDIIRHLKKFADDCIYIEDRHELFKRTRNERARLQTRIKKAFTSDHGIAKPLGIDPALSFEVHELRRAERTGPHGRPHPQMIVGITQQRPISVAGSDKPLDFHGGCTLVVDLKKPELKYAIRKRIDNQNRENRTAELLQQAMKNPLTALLLGPDRPNRFEALHALADLED